MAKYKSPQMVRILGNIDFLIKKFHVHTALAKETHIQTKVLHQILEADCHDGLIRTIIALPLFISKEELRPILHNMIDQILDMSPEDYTEHQSCYGANAFQVPSAIKKSKYPNYHKKQAIDSLN